MQGSAPLVAHLIGRPLIRFNFNQQRYEFDFRFAIARVTDQAEPVALMGGEPVERAELGRRFAALVRNWTGLVARQTRLTAFVAGYGHVSTVFPILVVSPAYLSGAIPLGTLMQCASRDPAGRRSVRLLHQRLRQDRRVEGGDGPHRAVRGGDGAGRCAATSARQDRGHGRAARDLAWRT